MAWARVMMLVLAVWMVSCGSGKNPTWGEPYRSCGDGVEIFVEHDYYVATAAWGEDENVGFDLDGERTSCEHGCINDGLEGVDNRMFAILGGLGDMMGSPLEETCTVPLCFPQNDVDIGDMNILIKSHLGMLPRDRICREYFIYTGLDLDGDPTDNLSGLEPFHASRISIAEYGDDLVEHALFRFDSGGEFLEDEYRPRPADRIEIAVRAPSGELVAIPFHHARISVTRTVDGIAGMIGGFILVEDLMDYVFRPDIQAVIEDLGYAIDPETVMSLIVFQADGDIVPEGQTDDACSTVDDCPYPWQDCGEDGRCVEPPDRMDAVSATLVYQAVECDITGIAEE